MTWVVKCEFADKTVKATLQDIWTKAVDLRDEFAAKGYRAWIEDTEGRLVGFTAINDPNARPQ